MVIMNTKDFKKILEDTRREVSVKGEFTEKEVLELALEKARIICVSEIVYECEKRNNNLIQEVNDTFYNLKTIIESEINNKNNNLK
jgi:hypothetical protein